jgi:hypothetical protein
VALYNKESFVNNFNIFKVMSFVLVFSISGCSSVSSELSSQISTDVINAYGKLDKLDKMFDIDKARVNVLSETKAHMIWSKMRIASTDMGVTSENQKITLIWELIDGKWQITSKSIKTKSDPMKLSYNKPLKQDK